MAGGGATVTDPETGESIEIEQLNPSDQCYDEFQQWVEENTKEGALVPQKLEEKGCISMSVSYTWESEGYLTFTDSDGTNNNHWSGASFFAEGTHKTDPDLGFIYSGKYWTEHTLKRYKDTPARATGVIFCRTVKKAKGAQKHDSWANNCSIPWEYTETKGKFTVKFDEKITVSVSIPPSCECPPSGEEDPYWGPCTSYVSESWDLIPIKYSYD